MNEWECPMAMVSPEEYLRLLNEELARQPEYTPDMKFLEHPPGARGRDVGGYTWNGDDLSKHGVYARVGQRIASQNHIVSP
jgi:hypothetical protein